MNHISDELAYEIGRLAFDFINPEDFKAFYTVSVGMVTMYRNFDYDKLLCSIMFYRKNDPEKGIHLNVMSNGDVFGRMFPYYDGELECVAIYNQRKIFDIVDNYKNI